MNLGHCQLKFTLDLYMGHGRQILVVGIFLRYGAVDEGLDICTITF